MANSYFSFKQFTVIQKKSAMKVGTDGVLLGAWAQCLDALKILDIGTGTGLIALMLAQRSAAQITAIEIEENAAAEAAQNFKNSPWCNRILLKNISLQEFTKTTTHKYDVIVSNPPYFTNSLPAQTNARNLARHNQTLSITDLLGCVKNLLAENGVFNLIIPADKANIFIESAKNFQLFCNGLVWIKPTPQTEPKRVLLSLTKTIKPFMETELVIEQNGRHKYSNEYKKLTKEFYLNID